MGYLEVVMFLYRVVHLPEVDFFSINGISYLESFVQQTIGID